MTPSLDRVRVVSGVVRVVWAVGLLALVGNLALERAGVDVRLSVEAGRVVRVGGEPLSDWGPKAVVEEHAARGELLDDGVGGFTLEMESPRPYSLLRGDGGSRAIRHLGGMYDDYETRLGSAVVPAEVLLTDGAGRERRVVAVLGYPDHDSETGTLVYHLQRDAARARAIGAVDDGVPLAPGPIRGITVRLHAP